MSDENPTPEVVEVEAPEVDVTTVPEAETAPESGLAPGTVPQLLESIAAELSELRTSSEQRRIEAEREIRGLRQQVEELRRWQQTSAMKPAFVQLVALHADLVDAASTARAEDKPDSSSDYEHFASSIERVLDNFDLESVEAAVDAPFDQSLHAAVLSRPTADPDQHQTIGRVVRQGFRVVGAERVLIPARVVVRRFQADDGPAGDAAAPTTTPELTHPHDLEDKND